MFSWLIRGSVLVYKIKETVNFDINDFSNYCNYTCYSLCFWTVTLTWSIIGFLILYIIIAIFYQSARSNNNNEFIEGDE